MSILQRAAYLHGPRDLRLGEAPRPTGPGPGQALVKIDAVGVCGSDLHMFVDGQIGSAVIDKPYIMGHEFAGTVVAVAEGAHDGTDAALTVGTRVAIEPAQNCGRCENCLGGDPNLCTDLRFLGSFPDHGALQDYLLVPAHCCFPVPDSLDAAAVAMLEPLGVAIHATDLAKPKLGNSACIVGAGTIGLLMLTCLRRAGVAPIFVTDRVPERLALAEQLGGIPLHADEDPAEQIKAQTKGRGVDIAIEAAWCDDHALAQAAHAIRLGGRMVIIGIPAEDRLLLPASAVRRKGATVRLCRRMKNTYPRAIHLVATGELDITPLITHRFPLEEAQAAFSLSADYQDGVVKAVVEL